MAMPAAMAMTPKAIETRMNGRSLWRKFRAVAVAVAAEAEAVAHRSPLCPLPSPVSRRRPRRRGWEPPGAVGAGEVVLAKGFNTTDVPLEFCLLQGKIAEASDAWHKGRETVGEELADVAI
jgi:hypothetical protein